MKKKLNMRKFLKTGIKTYHRGRTPGTVRVSRMPGGCGYRGDKLWEGKTGRDWAKGDRP